MVVGQYFRVSIFYGTSHIHPGTQYTLLGDGEGDGSDEDDVNEIALRE